MCGMKNVRSLHENQKPTSYCSHISDTELPEAFQWMPVIMRLEQSYSRKVHKGLIIQTVILFSEI